MVSINSKECIGCGACAAIAPDCFEMKGSVAVVKKGCKCGDACKEAKENCPVDAIQ